MEFNEVDLYEHLEWEWTDYDEKVKSRILPCPEPNFNHVLGGITRQRDECRSQMVQSVIPVTAQRGTCRSQPLWLPELQPCLCECDCLTFCLNFFSFNMKPPMLAFGHKEMSQVHGQYGR